MATKKKIEVVEEKKLKTTKTKKTVAAEVVVSKSWLEIAREKANAKYNK